MKMWGLIAVGAVLVAAVAYVVFQPSQVILGRLKGESFYGGRPTGYWAAALRSDPARAVEAVAQLKQGGSESVPVLIELLEEPGSDAAELRWNAAEILGEIGRDASLAGPSLLAALDDQDQHVRAVAARALPAVGVPAEQALEPLRDMLKHDQPIVAARVISEYKAKARPALADLVDVLTDKTLDSETRWNAARTIGKIGPDAAEAIPVLVASLEDNVDTVREHAAEALGDIGPPAGGSVQALVAVLDDPATRVRRDAVRSLGQVGEEAVVAVPEIKKLLDDPEEIVREAARNTLLAIAPEELPKKKKAKPESTTADPSATSEPAPDTSATTRTPSSKTDGS